MKKYFPLLLIGFACAAAFLFLRKAVISDQRFARSVHIPSETDLGEIGLDSPGKMLAGISIDPKGAVLKPKEIEALYGILYQVLLLVNAQGEKSTIFSKSTDLFKSLDASLSGVSGWENIFDPDKTTVDLATIVVFIAKTYNLKYVPPSPTH